MSLLRQRAGSTREVTTEEIQFLVNVMSANNTGVITLEVRRVMLNMHIFFVVESYDAMQLGANNIALDVKTIIS